ncbi:MULTISPECIES: beta-N-acetylhexosaminidase [unclassified Pedobacter]|uniref:beta-N-acetylhexosaminidase n=1 Tax=unclassified Pedobacter TaxID=2628915 RepID=UPI00141DBDAF|nr:MULTISPECIES: beta-N-acetylhexosaminidase [unclassified Pedobacter]NII83047.1 hexosaminidase [Pedobacter sp. SG908]NMN37065.1 hexosaminidase [Pedobacter sp. SG918]
MRFLYISIIIFVYNVAQAQQQVAIIPMPVQFVKGSGYFTLNNYSSIGYNNEQLKTIAYYFQNELLSQKGITVQQKAKTANIVLLLKAGRKHADSCAYQISIKPDQIIVSGTHPNGIFYGVVSLLQLALTNKNNQLPVVEITDTPAYGWRGFMLDESRHFFGKEKVKSILNWMAFYKLNIFHWHLTDEPAWRLEIKKYPNLALVGGIGDYLNPDLPAQFYTQADIKEIIAYAAERYIQVVPEIDMPGHATAANKAYPEYSGGGSAGHPEFTFNPGLEKTYTYLTDILKETNVLFPAGLIHLGGDEVSYGNEKWNTNPEILKLREREKLKDNAAVEHYFMKRMADSLYQLNVKAIFWDEMADVDLPKHKTVMFWWRQEKPEQLRTALSKGYPTVLCPRLPLYFDFVQDSTHQYGRKWNRLYNPIEQVYAFDAGAYAENDKEKSLILGIQANLWTETVDNNARLDYLLFPRIAALSEAAWVPHKKKDFKTFSANLTRHLALYNKTGLYYYDPSKTLLHPEIPVKRKKPLNYKD